MARKLTPAQTYAALDRAERRLSAAVTKWQKARAAVKRLDAKLDKAVGLPGEMDVRLMPIKVKPWPSEERAGRLIRKGS
jgi:hypothetical protein